MKRLLIVALLVPLAACDPPNTADEQNEAAAAIAAAPRAARGLPESKPSDVPVLAGHFPPAMLGRWGLVSADCDVSRGDAKGLLTIGPDTLKFYESTGTIAKLDAPSSYKVTAKLSFNGEGQTWQRVTTLELVMADTHLVRSEVNPTESYRYEKC